MDGMIKLPNGETICIVWKTTPTMRKEIYNNQLEAYRRIKEQKEMSGLIIRNEDTKNALSKVIGKLSHNQAKRFGLSERETTALIKLFIAIHKERIKEIEECHTRD